MTKLLPVIVFGMGVAGTVYLLSPASTADSEPILKAQAHKTAALLDPLLSRPMLPEHGVEAPSPTPVFDVDLGRRLVPTARAAVELDVLLAQLPGDLGRDDLRLLEQRVVEGLPEEEKMTAMRILHAYLQYRKAEAAFESNVEAGVASFAEERFRQLVALRRQHLGQQVADAFFAEREAQAWYGIQVTRVEADRTLAMQQKHAHLAALAKGLPDAAEEMGGDTETQAVRTTEWQVASLRERGASEDEVRRLREQILDREAMQSITEMEAHKADWERRYASFRQQAEAIHASPIGELDKQRHVEVLLHQHYRDDEIPAVLAYDREFGRR